ncbi:MAG: terminase gpA endonuclease subunit [Phycisphaerae bacterium]
MRPSSNPVSTPLFSVGLPEPDVQDVQPSQPTSRITSSRQLGHRPAPAATESHPPGATVEAAPVEQWSLNDANDADYNRQMTSEHKVLVRKAGGRQVEAWAPISVGAANHYWDCEVAQFALADMLRVDLLTEAGAQRRSWTERVVRLNRGERPWLSRRDDRPWLARR